MKKLSAIVIAMVLLFGFASVSFAMGPDGADPATVGFVLTDFNVSDALLSPLMMMNWSGTLSPSKAYSEGAPIWFVAHYVQNKQVQLDQRNFSSVSVGIAPAIARLSTEFTSKDDCVNFSYSTGYMNFTLIDGLQVQGGTVALPAAPHPALDGAVSATNKKLEVTFAARPATATDLTRLQVIDSDPVTVGNYHLQIMAFTRACSEAQGIVYAKMPSDIKEFNNEPWCVAATTVTPTSILWYSTNPSTQFTRMLTLYDADNSAKYIVAKYTLDPTAAFPNLQNIGQVANDSLYMVFDTAGIQIIGFVSSATKYRGMVKVDDLDLLQPVQYTSDNGGCYAFSNGTQSGEKAVETSDLQKLMTFLNFSFANDYPVLDKHFSAFAGYWKVLEAKYNIAN